MGDSIQRPIESCLMRATRCLSLKLINSVEPLMVRWESKTDRVNLCEVGGVSLPLMVLKNELIILVGSSGGSLVGVISIEN